jgi:hypothetical protein
MKLNENLIELIKLLNSDAGKADEFSKKKSKKELYEYCISLVPGYTEEEFTKFMEFLAAFSKIKDNSAGLSEKDLKKEESAEFMKFLTTYSKSNDNPVEISGKDLEHVSGGTSFADTALEILEAWSAGTKQGIELADKLKTFYNNYSNL